jgi:hypothetical protein
MLAASHVHLKVHTTSACAATNSAAGVSLSPRGRKANGCLHLSEWSSIIGERETGTRPSCEANYPMTDRRSPNADCGCQSLAGGVKGLTDRDCEKKIGYGQQVSHRKKYSDEGKIHERDDRTLVTGTPIRRGRKTHKSISTLRQISSMDLNSEMRRKAKIGAMPKHAPLLGQKRLRPRLRSFPLSVSRYHWHSASKRAAIGIV